MPPDISLKFLLVKYLHYVLSCFGLSILCNAPDTLLYISIQCIYLSYELSQFSNATMFLHNQCFVFRLERNACAAMKLPNTKNMELASGTVPVIRHAQMTRKALVGELQLMAFIWQVKISFNLSYNLFNILIFSV